VHVVHGLGGAGVGKRLEAVEAERSLPKLSMGRSCRLILPMVSVRAKAGIRLDLGGIVKSWAASRLARWLRTGRSVKYESGTGVYFMR